MSIYRSHEKQVVQHCQTSVDQTAAKANILGHLEVVSPESPACSWVEGSHVVGCVGEIHHSVNYEWGRLKSLQRLSLKHPLELKVHDVISVNLVQCGVVMSLVSARVSQPAPGFFLGLKNSVIGDLGRHRGWSCDEKNQGQAQFHWPPSFPRSE